MMITYTLWFGADGSVLDERGMTMDPGSGGVCSKVPMVAVADVYSDDDGCVVYPAALLAPGVWGHDRGGATFSIPNALDTYSKRDIGEMSRVIAVSHLRGKARRHAEIRLGEWLHAGWVGAESGPHAHHLGQALAYVLGLHEALTTFAELEEREDYGPEHDAIMARIAALEEKRRRDREIP